MATLPNPDSGSDFLVKLAFGTTSGYIRVAGLGATPAVAAAPYDVWEGAASTYPWMTAATALEAASSSAQDGAAGTGIASILVQGLDAAFNPINQTVQMNGITPVALPTSLFRINSVTVSTKGAGAAANGVTNAGDISIRDAGAGTVRAFMSAGAGFARQSQYTVPLGFTLQVLTQDFSMNAPANGRSASFSIYLGPSNGVARLPKVVPIGQSGTVQTAVPGLVLPEKTDFMHRVTELNTAGAKYYSAWNGVLKLNAAN